MTTKKTMKMIYIAGTVLIMRLLNNTGEAEQFRETINSTIPTLLSYASLTLNIFLMHMPSILLKIKA